MSFTNSRWGDVYITAAARAVSTCGDFLAATALALVLQQAGAGGLAVSGLLLAAGLPVVLLAPVTGRVADRADSRVVLVVAGFGQAGVCAGLAFVRETGLIVILVGVLACGLAVTQPTLAALLPAMVRRADLPRASAINQTASMGGMLVAPALAGVLVGQFGARVPLFIDAASYLALVAAGLLLRTRRSGTRETTTAKPPWRLRDDRLIAAMLVALAAVVGGVGAINVIEVFFLRDTLHASTTLYGLVTAAWFVGMLIGAPLFARFARRRSDAAGIARWNLLLLAGPCAIVLLSSALPNAWPMLPLWVAGGICNGGTNVAMNLLMTDRVPTVARGRAFASLGAAAQGANLAGFLIGGLLIEHFAPRPLVTAAGLAGLIALLACTPLIWRAARRDREIRPSMAAVPGPVVTAGDSVGA
jgi:MFS family permease